MYKKKKICTYIDILRGSKGTPFQKEKHDQAWLLCSVEGLNALALELFTLEEYPAQFTLYRQFRPFKDPGKVHAVDTAFANAHNEKTRYSMARLFNVESSYVFPSFPDDLFNWSMKKKLNGTPDLIHQPKLEKLKLIDLHMKKDSLEALQSWFDLIQLFLFSTKRKCLLE